jgi:elongation factor P
MVNFLNFLKNIDVMIFLKSKDFKVGLKVEINDEPFCIVENEFVNPGKGQAFNRLKLKSFISGLVIRKTIKLGEKIKSADLFELKVKYLYCDNSSLHFINEDSLEYYDVDLELIGTVKQWLKEGCYCFIVFWNDKILYVKPPKFIELSVIECEDINTMSVISKASKNAILETGASVKVPLFIKINDVVKIDSEDEIYVSRVN